MKIGYFERIGFYSKINTLFISLMKQSNIRPKTLKYLVGLEITLICSDENLHPILKRNMKKTTVSKCNEIGGFSIKNGINWITTKLQNIYNTISPRIEM